jgi:hypothetical protein
VTTFTVDPVGNDCQLRFETSWQPHRGIAGRIERLIAPRLLRRLFEQELDLIAQWADKQHASGI